MFDCDRRQLRKMGFQEVTRPYKSSNLPGYTGYCPQLRFKCGRSYGADTDKLTKSHTRNEKLSPTRQLDTSQRSISLPPANGDNKLTANMVPGYTGYVPIHSPGFIYGSRYKESTEEALTKFLQSNDKQRRDLYTLHRTAATSQKLRKRPDFQDPTYYPDLNPRHGKNYKSTDRKDFCEPPVIGYAGFIPNIEQYGLGQRYTKWTEEGLDDAVRTRLAREYLRTQPIHTRSAPAVPEGMRTSRDVSSLGGLYKEVGMVPKYTGYIPRARFRFGKTYGDTTRQGPACADPHGYAAGKYVTFPIM